MRYEMEGRNLFVMPDAPVLRHYRVDYLNVAREARSEIGASTSIARGGSGAGGQQPNSTLTNNSHNRFWETLTQNIRDLLRETDKIIPEGGGCSTGSGTCACASACARSFGACGVAAPVTPPRRPRGSGSRPP